MIQKRKEPFWFDESGNKIPVNRITKNEFKREKIIGGLYSDAVSLNQKISDFKKKLLAEIDVMVDDFICEMGIDDIGKGNLTLFNFDRTIKVELRVSNIITFDDMHLSAAKQELDIFLNENIDTKIDFLKEVVVDAFSTSRGKLDTKKVFGLMKHEKSAKNENYSRAMNFLQEGIRNNGTRSYQRIAVKDDQGKWNYIILDIFQI